MLNEMLAFTGEHYGKKVEEINDNENLKDYIKEGIESEKAIDFIVKNAKIKWSKKKLGGKSFIKNREVLPNFFYSNRLY